MNKALNYFVVLGAALFVVATATATKIITTKICNKDEQEECESIE